MLGPGEPVERPRVAVCVCTFRRPLVLDTLLQAMRLVVDEVGQAAEVSLVVVDDSPGAEARDIVDRHRSTFDGRVTYAVTGSRNISTARNEALETGLATADLLAFIDDDCTPDKRWLQQLLEVQREFDADIVTGRCHDLAAPGSPRWYLDEPWLAGSEPGTDGDVLAAGPLKNSLFRSESLARTGVRFDDGFGRTGGEDALFFLCVHKHGLFHVHAASAIVEETVTLERATEWYQFRRALWYGNTEARTNLAAGGQSRARLVASSTKRIASGPLRVFRRTLRGESSQWRWSVAVTLTGVGRLLGATGVQLLHSTINHRRNGSTRGPFLAWIGRWLPRWPGVSSVGAPVPSLPAELPQEELAASARRLLDVDDDQVLLADVARHLVAVWAAGGDPHAGLTDDEFRRLARLLVLDGPPHDPPALHTAVANYHSGGVPGILAVTGSILEEVLIELLADERVERNVVLMVMLLRDHLGETVTQGDVSALHLGSLGSFTAGELTLPYSNAFSEAFQRNCDDVRSAVHESPDLAERLPLLHQLVFEWLTGEDVAEGPDQILARLALDPGMTATDASAETAAAKSLLIRRTGAAHQPSAAQLESLGGTALVHLFETVRARRAALPEHTIRSDEAAVRLSNRRRWAVRGARSLVSQRLSITPRRRPRVAVCVSGQLRGYDAALATWRSSLLRVADCDIFVHTWANVGRSSAEGFRSILPFAGTAFSSAYREVALRRGFDEVKAHYPKLFAELAESGTVTAEELSRCYQTDFVVVEDETTAPFDGWTNQQKMHAKIERAFELAESTGRSYDLVVRVRPDKPISFTAFAWSDVIDVCNGSPTVLADMGFAAHYAKPVIGDQFAMGSPEVMATYCRTASLYPTLAEAGLHECATELSGHSSLAQVCWLHGIEVRRAPIKFGPLQEAAPMSAAEIKRHLEHDARDRSDADDRRLLDAVGRDLSA